MYAIIDANTNEFLNETTDRAVAEAYFMQYRSQDRAVLLVRILKTHDPAVAATVPDIFAE